MYKVHIRTYLYIFKKSNLVHTQNNEHLKTTLQLLPSIFTHTGNDSCHKKHCDCDTIPCNLINTFVINAETQFDRF